MTVAQRFDAGLAQAVVSEAEFGSDVIVDMLRALGIRYAALNPGASFRGLHDSLVNYQGGAGPQILLCCHEEIAVALAQGYAMATGQPMAAILHDVVGLLHGTMAIFNAWCDRAPVLVLGGTGPMDTQGRRPWIEFVHTALVQGNQVRDYVKLDDQPASVEAIPESMLRAYRAMMCAPQAPVYVCFDGALQEQPLAAPPALPDPRRFAPPRPPAPDPSALAAAADMLLSAQWPVIVADDAGRSEEGRAALLDLAEALAAPIVDRGGRYNLPSTHPLDLTSLGDEVLNRADVVLVLEAHDVEQALGAVSGRTRNPVLPTPDNARVIHIGLGTYLQRSWVQDEGRLTPVDLPIAADVGVALPLLLARCQQALDRGAGYSGRRGRVAELAQLRLQAKAADEAWRQQDWERRPITNARLYGALWPLIKDGPWSLVNGQIGSARRIWEFTEPQQWLGGGKGGGLGMGAGVSIGAALAFRDEGLGRLCIDVQGDGDFLMTPAALWTAARYQIPLLMVVFDNRSYFQDVGHQEYVALQRKRPEANKGIGIDLDQPNTDFASLARSFSIEGFGPVEDPADLARVLAEAIAVVKSGRPALVDVIAQGRGG